MTEDERAEKLRQLVKSFFDDESLKWLPELAQDRLRREEELSIFLKLKTGVRDSSLSDSGLNTLLYMKAFEPLKRKMSRHLAAQERGETELKFSHDELFEATSDEWERLQDEAYQRLLDDKNG
jgi:hypothetical protein